MSRYHVATTALAAAPIDVVWARVADITTWSQWGQWDETVRGTRRPPRCGRASPAGTQRFFPATARSLARSAEADATARP